MKGIDSHTIDTYREIVDVARAIAVNFPELPLIEWRILMAKRKMPYAMTMAPIRIVTDEVIGILLTVGHDGLAYRWHQLSKSAQYGLVAHELAHGVQFQAMTNARIYWSLLKYLVWPRYRRAFEREADMIAIERGFGRQLEAYATHALESASPRHRRRKEKFYMSPEEIREARKLVGKDGN